MMGGNSLKHIFCTSLSESQYKDRAMEAELGAKRGYSEMKEGNLKRSFPIQATPLRNQTRVLLTNDHVQGNFTIIIPVF